MEARRRQSRGPTRGGGYGRRRPAGERADKVYRIPKKGREQGKGAVLPAGGRKRRVEEEGTSGTRGKSPRGDEDEEGLFDYDEERDGVGELSDEDVGR